MEDKLDKANFYYNPAEGVRYGVKNKGGRP